MIYERQIIDGISFGFSVTDGIIVDPHEVCEGKFMEAITRAAELFLVFERVAIFAELGHYSDDTSVDIKHALEAVDRISYPPSKIVDELRNGYNQYKQQSGEREQKRLLKESKRKLKSGYVYLLQSPTGAYKIGRTNNPDNRLKTFGVTLPFEVEYVALIETDDMVGLERQLHKHYDEHRLNGEWFDLTDEHVENIQALEGEPQL